MAEIRSYFPAWRVFIFGVDVTEDVTRCIVNYTGSESRAPSTAEIELVNGGTRGQLLGAGTESPTSPSYTNDRYIITEQDIATLYGIEDQLENIRFASVKDVLEELNREGPPPTPEASTTPPLPTLAESLAIIRPDLATGNPLDDATIALGLGVNELQFRLEAQRRSVAYNTARELTQARKDQKVQTRIAARIDQIDRIVRERIRSTILDPVKLRVLDRKFNIRQQINAQSNLVDTFDSTMVAGIPQLTGQVLRYPFQTGDSIFHTNDAVRIFWRDPTTTDRWFHMFAGFISDYVDSVDADNQRIIRFRVEDASRILRYARITTNPGILDIDDVAVVTDAETRTFFNDGFSGLTLPEFLFTVVFGADKAGTGGQTGTNDVEGVRAFSNIRFGVNGETASTLLEDAVGSYNFERSFIAVFGPRDQETESEASQLPLEIPNAVISNLAQYQALVDHQVYFSDLDNMSLQDPASQARVARLRNDVRKRSDGTFINEDIVKVIGENPELFPVDFGRLIFLIPGSLGPAANQDLLLRDIIGVNTQTTWRTRLALIYDVVERLDFQFYASPRGDLICEMPLYDFEPDDFGNDSIDLTNFLSLSTTNITFDAGTDRERGPFGPAYRVAKRDTLSWERTFIDENVRTQMVGIYSLIQGFAELPTSLDIGQVAPVNLYGLMPQFGVRSEFIEPQGIIANENAARIYANVKLNQINSNAKQANVQVLPRVQLGFPNRPMEFEERTFVATTRAISHSLVWGLQGDMTTDLDLKYVRAWSGQVTSDPLPGVEGPQPPRPVYEPIGGFASQPLNYALRFGLRDPSIRSTREN